MPDRSPSFARHSGHAQNLLCQAVAGGHCVPTPYLSPAGAVVSAWDGSP